MEHTKGPWRVADEGWGPGHIFGQYPASSLIATIENLHIEEAEANARLIAACPELLEACKLVLANLEPLYPSDHLCIKNLRATIDKATREETKP